MSAVSRIRTRNGSVAASATARHLSIQVGQLNFLAQWEIDAAPKTCELFGRILPVRMKMIHCAWSGEGVWIRLGKWEASWHRENDTSLPKPGQLLLHPGGPSEPELLIPCGVCVFNSKFGILKGNHFATITEGIDDLGDLHRLLLWQGAQDCIIEEIFPA